MDPKDSMDLGIWRSNGPCSPKTCFTILTRRLPFYLGNNHRWREALDHDQGVAGGLQRVCSCQQDQPHLWCFLRDLQGYRFRLQLQELKRRKRHLDVFFFLKKKKESPPPEKKREYFFVPNYPFEYSCNPSFSTSSFPGRSEHCCSV